VVQHVHHEPVSAEPLFVAARRVVPWLLLMLMLVWVGSLYGRYRISMNAWEATQLTPSAATKAAQAARAEKTAPASKPPAPKPATVLVVADVSFRQEADFSSSVMRDLTKGDRLTLVAKSGSWYKVRDARGATGFVTTATKYTRLVLGK
jgi:hypothetical protein